MRFVNQKLEMYNDRHKVRIASWSVACANNLEKPSNKGDYDKKIENMATIICESKGDIIEIIVFNKDDIEPIFALQNFNILNKKRGDGYWLWKSYIISKTLEKVNTND